MYWSLAAASNIPGVCIDKLSTAPGSKPNAPVIPCAPAAVAIVPASSNVCAAVPNCSGVVKPNTPCCTALCSGVNPTTLVPSY